MATAAPQPDPDPPPDPDLRTKGSRRAGPFHYWPFVELRNLGYDDNVFYSSTDPQGDTTATVGAGLRAVVRTGDRGGLFLYQDFDYVAFQTFGHLNYWNGRSRARGSWWTENFLVSAEGDFRSSEGRPNTEFDQRVRRRNQIAAARFRTRSLGRLEMEVELRRERIDYPEDDRDSVRAGANLNRDENRVELTGGIRIRPKTEWIVGATLESVQFAERTDATETRATGIETGLRFAPTSKLTGGFRIGPMQLEVPGRPDLDWDGWIGGGDLGTRFGSRGRVAARFDRDVNFSTLAGNLYFIHQKWSASYEHFFTRRASLEARYGNGANEYQQPTVSSAPGGFQGVRSDRLAEAGMEFHYRLDERMKLSLGVIRQERDSNDDFYDLENTVVSFGTRYEF